MMSQWYTNVNKARPCHAPTRGKTFKWTHFTTISKREWIYTVIVYVYEVIWSIHFHSIKWNYDNGIGEYPWRSWCYLICIITRGLCSYNARLFNDDFTAIGLSYWRRREFPNYARLHRGRMTYHRMCSVAFTWGHFLKSTLEHKQCFFLKRDYVIFSVWLFSCEQAARRTLLSVCLSHFFDNVPLILSSWNFQELFPMTKVMPMQKDKGQRSKVKVTEVMTPFSHFRTVAPVWIYIWQWNDAQSLMLLRRGALLFSKVIRQISRSHS